jgi:hypothetical protein
MGKYSEIAFTRDIARSVGEELGMTTEAVESHIDFMVHWIKEKSKTPTTLNIQIPHIGNMYLNMGRVKNDYDHFSKLNPDEMVTSWATQLERHRIRLETFKEQFPDGGYNRHKKRTKITSNWFNKKMSFRELEEWQNKSI